MSLVVRTHPTCQQIVEVITNYLEGAMAPEDRDRFEMHLATCAACVTYYDQIRAAQRAASALRRQPTEAEAIAPLLRAFREWKDGSRE